MSEKYLGKLGQAVFYSSVIALGTYGFKNVLEGENISSGLALSVASVWIVGESGLNFIQRRRVEYKNDSTS